MREGSHLQARTSVSEMLLLPWGAAGRLEVGGLIHGKTSPVGLAILPTRQSEQRGTRFTSLLGSFGVFKFWAELLFLGLFQACCRGLQCRWAPFCVSSWSSSRMSGHALCTTAIVSRLVLGPRRDACGSCTCLLNAHLRILGQKEWLPNLLGLLLGLWFSILRFIHYYDPICIFFSGNL